MRIATGDAEGRQLFCITQVGNLLVCDAEGETSNQRFSDVKPGDELHIDNHAFLAYCYYYRHHLRDSSEFDFLRLEGHPVYPQHEQIEMSPFMGTCHTGRFEGKMLWLHHTHDASLWPSQGLGMKRNVERERAGDADKYYKLRWLQNAEHVPPAMAASPPGRANNTWLVDYAPHIEQSLADLTAWVEDGVEPATDTFEFRDGRVVLPVKAKERGGIQPVVSVRANGVERAEVRVGEHIRLEAHAEVADGAGAIVSLRWDFDGSGSYPETATVESGSADVTVTTTHAYDELGTYFATALVESHRDGDADATTRRIPNLASARIVVRPPTEP